MWGLFPLYWPLLEPANPLEIVSHRAVWTLVFCLIALALSKQIHATLAVMKNPKTMAALLLSTILVSINWITYIWAVNHGHVVEAALGYYINPLIIIAFGVILLREKMRPLQWVAVGIAAVGVLVLTIDYGRLPWVAISLALSWGSYGLVKKKLNLGALEGLAIETLISFIPYAAYIIYLGQQGTGQFGHKPLLTILLISAGAVTAIPLLLFNGSTTRLPYSTIGLLQYITPTIQFSIGVWLRHEDMPTARWIGFIVIWFALAALATDLVRSSRAVDNRIA
ncbi:chloramphenicol-sensitive protein RarD [Candidatus Planktophila sulfonica]|uniref:Chloramphenicol-sensitive protein RarD n=2 Tax=Candidatus Planktophila sulfonica TaxID=1884904 RepID=A0A249KHX7_9ACTN|nr:chloramphenicol-sensitive protein RarD [Candidatus Planktophila sulfonica]